MTLPQLITLLAGIAPVSATSTPALDTALTSLDVDLTGDTIIEASITLVLAGLTGSIAVLAIGARLPALGVLFAGAATATTVLTLPHWLARTRETRALGELPDLIGFAMLHMRINPTLERAGIFAATHARGPLSTSLREHLHRARGTRRDGWSTFASAWQAEVPSLPRATSLLAAAAASQADDRSMLLDDALTVVLSGTQSRMAAYAAALRGPTTGIYALGVVLPLASIGALPTLRAAGLPISILLLSIVYNGVVPLAVLGASVWLLTKRPAAFPPATVTATHPELTGRKTRLTLAVPGTILISWMVSRFLFPPWTMVITVPAVTAGVALTVWTRPVRAVRKQTRTIETALPEALSFIGHRLKRGASPEAAIEAAGETLDGAIGTVFQRAAAIHERVTIGIDAAMTGEHGALTHVDSPRIQACATLITVAGREGPHGGEVLINLGDHLDALTTLQTESQRDLARIVGTFRSTACCFAPMIGGVTVALTARIEGANVANTITNLDTGAVGLIVGGYVVAMAVILAGLAAALEEGLDRAVVGEHVGYALLSAGVVYPVSVMAAGWLV